MLEVTEQRQIVRNRALWRYLLFALLALLAGAYLMVGHALASSGGASAEPQGGKVSSSAVQPGQAKPANPDDCAANYVVVQSEGATPVAGTTLVTGSQCDDCFFTIALPFAYSLYNHSYTSVTASSNGQLDFGTPTDPAFSNSCLPDTHAGYAIFPFWSDMNMGVGGSCTSTSCGVFTSASGSAPNRVFNIEYRAVMFGASNPVNFTLRLYEGQQVFDVIYTALSTGPGGRLPTVGVQQSAADGGAFLQYQCPGNAGSLTTGSMLTFTFNSDPGCPTFTPTNTPPPTATGTPPTATPTSTHPTSTPTATRPTNTPFPTICAANYQIVQSEGASPVAGTDLVTGSQCDDCSFNITLPFAYSLYGRSFSSVSASSNGQLDFGTPTDLRFINSCLPDTLTSYAIFPHWYDLIMSPTANCSNCGVYTSVSGSAPNRVFNIEYRAVTFGGGIPINFTLRLYEGQQVFDVIYTTTGVGITATIGVEQDNVVVAQYQCPGSPGTLTDGSMLTFTLVVPQDCSTATPTNTPVVTATNTHGPTNTPVNTRTPTATGTAFTPTPAATCGPGSNYTVSQSSGASIVPGTTLVAGSRCDDCIAAVALPFTYNLYGVPYTTVNASSNGNLQFTGNYLGFGNFCLPANYLSMAILPYWDDLVTNYNVGDGIFTSVSGSAPNRILNIEWRGTTFPGGSTPVNFEVRLYEGQDRFDLIYGQVITSGSSTTVGVQRDMGQYTQFSCNTASLSSGLQLTFEEQPCAVSRHTLTAHMVWSGRPAQPNPLQALPIHLILRPAGGGPDIDYPGQSTDASGNVTIPVDGVANGDYTWWAKGPQFLAGEGPITLSGAPDTQVEMGTMSAGDANNDNAVNVSDFSLLKVNFAIGCGNVGYDSRPDFNGDCVVDIRDFVLLKTTFGNSGATLPGPGTGN